MNDILNEIKHDIAEERYLKIFTEHGKKLIMAGVAIILLTAALTTYKNISESKSRESGALFLNAFDDPSPEKYDAVIAKGQKAYAPMAALIKAAQLSNQDKTDEAIKTLDEVANNTSYDQAFRDKAKIDKISILIRKNGKKEDITRLLEDVTAAKAPFRYTALELKGHYLLSIGDKKQALEVFTLLAKDEQTPSTLQDRAKHILAE